MAIIIVGIGITFELAMIVWLLGNICKAIEDLKSGE